MDTSMSSLSKRNLDTLHPQEFEWTEEKGVPKEVDIFSPEKLSQFLHLDAFEKCPDFVTMQQNCCAKLEAQDDGKILLLPAVSFCTGLAFHSKETDTWYALHIPIDDIRYVLESFESSSKERPGFVCDQLVFINAPDVVNGIRLNKRDVAAIPYGILEKLGGSFIGKMTHVSCAFGHSYEERRWSMQDNERRQIMLVPKAHSIYLFDENGKHLSTHPLG